MLATDTRKVLSYINANDDLKYYFNYYMNYNISYDNPYHNMSHTIKVLNNIINISEEMKIDNFNLYCLILSGIFHDFNHSGGRFSDSVNIHNAKAGLSDCVLNYKKGEENISVIVNECFSIIDATKWPYEKKISELSLNQKIMRESDILVLFYDDLSSIMFMLKSELRQHDNSEVIKNEIMYIKNIFNELELDYSKRLIGEYQGELYDIIDGFINIIK